MNESPSENVLKLGSGCLYMTPTAYFLLSSFISIHRVSQSQFFICNLFNTLTSGLIQAVHKKRAGSHVALHGNISVPVWVTDLVEMSKDTASLVVCTRKKFFCLGDAGFL